MVNEKQLNELAHGFLSGNIMHKFSPVKFSGRCSVTVCPKEADAFCLNDIVAGTVKKYTRNIVTQDQAVARKLISYACASSWLENEDKFYYDVSMCINDMLCSLVDVVGDLSNREVYAERPGSGHEYFRSFESFAGYELRLFVK